MDLQSWQVRNLGNRIIARTHIGVMHLNRNQVVTITDKKLVKDLKAYPHLEITKIPAVVAEGKFHEMSILDLRKLMRERGLDFIGKSRPEMITILQVKV